MKLSYTKVMNQSDVTIRICDRMRAEVERRCRRRHSMNLLTQEPQPKPSYRLIPLTQGQFAKVSPEDYERMMQWKWQAQWDSRAKSFKAMRGSGKRVLMHREVLMVTDPSIEVDHKDHDTLNNQRYNLRRASRSQIGSRALSSATATPVHAMR